MIYTIRIYNNDYYQNDLLIIWTEYILHSSQTTHSTFRVFIIHLFIKYAIYVHQITSNNLLKLSNKILPLLFTF